ncbi:uncharacterized protein LOC115449838 [Manduca sexta]|uniref:uncharacterized protein LOC115449838 n=1 Tax=Manduca sexta TaxID=7130 RepID=UPI00188EFCD9|nr:uncharacterized protein LOC115449838 [Manduca sexta]
MYYKVLFIFCGVISASSQTHLRYIFPETNTEYIYVIKTNVSISTGTPKESGSYWAIEGKLHVNIYDDFTRARLQLYGLKKYISGTHGTIDKEDKFISEPWELDYQESGLINSIYIGDEPVWSANLKRGISINFQLIKKSGTYSESEPCLDSTCMAVYTVKGDTIKKFYSYRIPTTKSARSWSSIPWTDDFSARPVVDSIVSAEREYILDDKKGLSSLQLKGSYQYKTHEHILAVTSTLTLKYLNDAAAGTIDKINVTQAHISYVATDSCDPTNGIRNMSQDYMKNYTKDLLLKVANGIDADNIVREASLIHNSDFIELLNTISQLTYNTLVQLFEDLVLSTSYDMETCRNIFLEVLPHTRSEACARFIKYLILEQKKKIEDAALLSLIRKLPHNVATLSQGLLEDLEVFTRLGLDFPQDIRHAGILSFATLVHKTMNVKDLKQDYFDNIVVKYFRMYSDCPQYLDRMVWLQGLCNIGYSAEDYIRIIFADSGRDRHERFWSALGISSKVDDSYKVLEMVLTVLTNETEHIQLRVVALHMFLSSQNIRESDFMFVHNYIHKCGNNQLKRFWYTTIKNLEASKTFSGYKVSPYYVPFVANQVSNPDPLYFATNNYIICGQEEVGSPSLQVLSVGDPLGAFPPFIGIKLNTGGRRPYKAAVYLNVEGVTASFYRKFLKSLWTSQVFDVEKLVQVLKNMKAWTLKTPEKVHIDMVIKVHDRTIFATHMNQSRFDTMNGEDLAYIEDFLRFGSHINQQIVYYPFQSDVHVPTELGTPIRLQSTIVSFTSIRGNLTAPTTEDLTWRNDLHIRYQGTSVTSLSIDAPVIETSHIARIQQSLVAHLPMKFNISFSTSDGSLELTWPNPGAQQSGVAMHSRVQIAVECKKGRHNYTYTVGDTGGEVKDQDSGIFFDCERPVTGADVFNKLLTTKNNNYDFFTSVQPSHIILNTILLFTSPPSGSCGLILSPQRLQNHVDDVLQAKVQARYRADDEGVMKLDSTFLLSYYRMDDPQKVFLKMEATTKMEQNSVGNTNLMLSIHGYQPDAKSSNNKKDFTICFRKKDMDSAASDQDLAHPVSYEGHITLTFIANESMCFETQPTSEITLKYKGVPQSQGKLERNFEIKIFGRNLSEIGILDSQLISSTAIGQILKGYTKEPLNVTAVITERNGLASLSLNRGAIIQFKSDNFAWLLDGWTGMQVMRTLGLYRECRIHDTSVKTLSGATDYLPSTDCLEMLALADCSGNSPRFAVIKFKNGVKMYSGGYYISVKNENSELVVDDSNAGDHFWVSRKSGVKITSRLTALRVYYSSNETLLMVPHMYLNTVCGLCTDVAEYNVC